MTFLRAPRGLGERLPVLSGLRWQVREAEGGAQAWAEAENAPVEAVIVDTWLPDLDVNEFLKDFRGYYPNIDLVTANGPLRVFTLLHDARPILLNLGEPGGFDITP